MLSKPAQFIGRFSLAFCFITFGLWELIQANYWTAYVPTFMAQIVDPILLVHLHGIILAIVGLGVLIGIWPRVFTGLSVLVLLEILSSVVFVEGFTDILVRDISIFLFAVALFVDAWQVHQLKKTA